LTFNYDTLLEQALDAVSKPYRLFPHRFSEIYDYAATVDASREEVVILKMHGSVDWFDKTAYNELSKPVDGYTPRIAANHPVFGTNAGIIVEPIVDGPRFSEDYLTKLYRVKDPTPLYDSVYWWQCAPFLLSPSHSKLLYAKPLSEFWQGLGRSGGLNLGFGIIGYSLPVYDDYACQAIYKIAQNYQEYEPDFELGGRVKRPVRIMDLRSTESAKKDLQKTYQFMERKRTEYWYSGLCQDGIEWFMA